MTTSHLPGPILFWIYSAFASMDSEFRYASSMMVFTLDFKLYVILPPQYSFWSKYPLSFTGSYSLVSGFEQSIGLKI